ncbi:MAG: PAS domain-containing sensor histidine kinase [Gammaproteobacteria bacterium]
MASDPLKRRITALGAVAAMSLVLLGSLILMSGAMQDSARFGALFSILLLTNTIGLLVFIVLIAVNVRRLVRQLRARRPGSRLTLRLLVFFVALAVAPVTVLYGFSLDFLRRGIDSWFDARIDAALDDALALGREALDLRMRQLLGQTERMADELSQGSPERTPLSLDLLRNPDSIVVASAWVPGPAQVDALRERNGAEEMTLIGNDGEVLASSSRITDLVPHLPPEPVLTQARAGRAYIGLDPLAGGNLYVRVAVPVNLGQTPQGRRVLHALYPFPARVNELAASVEAAYAKYNELAYLREKLKLSFAMSLTLVLLFSIVVAVWAAFYSARRLAAPIRDLAEGTAAVAAGDYTTSLPVASNDDVGFLVRSFNDMTRRIAQARREVETQHEYLDSVLRQLSSGVMTLDEHGRITTVNDAALMLLDIDAGDTKDATLAAICADDEHLHGLGGVVLPLIEERRPQWQEQITILAAEGRRELMCRGSTLHLGRGPASGHVIVFEDITAIIQGQRDAAWSEVARRLAHEIKNPLTPIQLAAERLRLKYLRKLGAEDGELLERLTNTIVQQVDTMKAMVNTFSDYAKAPVLNRGSVDVNHLASAVVELFRSAHPGAHVECRFEEHLPELTADPTRLRQVMNNLIKNALEASPDGTNPHIIVSTATVHHGLAEQVEIRIEDHGDGIPEDLVPNIFDPYVTNKPRGTGLGLAIVKKIVEEHNGVVTLRNKPQPDHGAVAVIRLPAGGEHGRERDEESAA